MTLTPGARLGPYLIEATLGAGGMGEVYKARDPRLDRVVAIKVIRPDHTGDPQQQQRFDREARAVAALSHPNICAIHDVGQDAGIAYLVMEYLDGETLADRLATGGRVSAARVGSEGGGAGSGSGTAATGRPLPIGETLGIAVQLANALAVAHNAGIVHRDLKPSNIVLLRGGVTQQGAPQVKVLDFGLARMAGPVPQTEAPHLTISAPLTGVGMLVGTLPYMSPEQVEGRDVDARSDIFSLGSVIYEMATGRRAFDAGSQAGVIAAILDRQPDPIATLQPMTPAGLERIVRTCLAKPPGDRWQHASDVARQLGWLASEAESGTHAAPASGMRPPIHQGRWGRSWRGWPYVVAGAACALLAADMVWRPLGRSTSVSPAGITSVHVPLDVPGITIGNVLVSPDGRTLAISGVREDGRRSLLTQRLADGRATEIPNLDADARLFGWSRDGTELAVRTARGIVAIRLDGSIVRPLVPGAEEATINTWGESDVLFGAEQGIRAIAIGTGAARDLVKGMALRPRFLPDGRRFMYTSRAEAAQGNPDGLYVSSVDAPAIRRMILAKRSSGAYADGYLFFAEDGTLFGQPFDVTRAELSGSPVPVLDGVRYFHPNGAATFDVGGGTIVYATPPPDDSPVWVDRRGAVTGKLGAAGLYLEPRISPDGRRVVYSRFDRRHGTGDLWLQDLARHTTVRLTNDEWSEAHVKWSRDGRTIAYRSDRDGPPDVVVQDVDAGTPPRTLYATPGVDNPVSWLPGDRLLVQTSTQFRAIKSDGTIDDTITVSANIRGGFITASPDGRWLALTALENGKLEIYVQPLGRPGPVVRVSADGGAGPVWSADGRWLYFSSGRTVMQAAVHAGGEAFAADPATVVFSFEREIADFHVSPDGQRFLVLPSAPPDFRPYRLLVNWRAALK